MSKPGISLARAFHIATAPARLLPFQHPVRRWVARIAHGQESARLRCRCLHVEPFDVSARARRRVKVLSQVVAGIENIYPESVAMKASPLVPWSAVSELDGGLVVIKHAGRPVETATFFDDDDVIRDGWAMGCALLWTGSVFVGVLLPNWGVNVGKIGSWSQIPQGAIDPFRLA